MRNIIVTVTITTVIVIIIGGTGKQITITASTAGQAASVVATPEFRSFGIPFRALSKDLTAIKAARQIVTGEINAFVGFAAAMIAISEFSKLGVPHRALSKDLAAFGGILTVHSCGSEGQRGECDGETKGLEVTHLVVLRLLLRFAGVAFVVFRWK